MDRCQSRVGYRSRAAGTATYDHSMQSFGGHRISPTSAALVVAAVLSACSAGPSTRTPSVDASPSATETARAGTPEPTPTATLSPSPTLQPPPAPAELVVAIRHSFYSATWTATSLVADGRLTSPAEGGYEARLLSPSGVERVRTEVLATGLFTTSADVPLVPLPNAVGACLADGLGNYSLVRIDVATDSGPVIVSWQQTHLPRECYEPSPARDRLEALLDRLVNLERWLPADAWVDPVPRPYQPEALRLFTISQPSEDRFGRRPEVTAVDWPLAGTLTTFGSVLDLETYGPYSIRCGAISADQAAAVTAALADAGAAMEDANPAGYASGTLVDDAANDATVAVILEVMRPDEPGCDEAEPSFINCWNLGGVEPFYCAVA